MFTPKFAASDVQDLAEQYTFNQSLKGQETERYLEETVAAQVRRDGYLTKADFLVLCCWKSHRPKPYYQSNSEEDILHSTGLAFSTPSEKIRMASLTSLRGVSYRVASAILHLTHSDVYPILDFRALWSLGIENPRADNFNFWWDYTQYFRQLVADWDVHPRTLDRALWQFSKQQG